MTTRVFVPVTALDLRVLAADGALPAGTWSAHAVTDGCMDSEPTTCTDPTDDAELSPPAPKYRYAPAPARIPAATHHPATAKP